MKIPDTRARALRLQMAAILALATLPVAAHASAAADVQLLPDMLMAAPYNVHVEVKPSGKRLLRFGTIVWNVGEGPLEVRARNRSGTVMKRVSQRITTAGGTTSVVIPGMTAFYAGDGHNHWHVAGFIDVSLVALAATTGASEPRHLRKIGFCLADVVRAPAALRPANAVLDKEHLIAGCGTRKSKRLGFGISVGWGDDYRPFFSYQQINVTGLPKGTYRLCATVNPAGVWHEGGQMAANNSYWFDLDLNVRKATVAPIADGLGPCQ